VTSGIDQSPQRFLDRTTRLHHGSRLIPAVRHAVVAARVVAAAVLRPVGGLDELLVGLRVAVGHQVAGALPAEQRVARDPPGSALVVDLALQEVEEERGVVEAPPLAAHARTRTKAVPPGGMKLMVTLPPAK